jgi:hypothetical protein
VLIQRKLFRPIFNPCFAKSSTRVHVSLTPLQPLVDGSAFTIVIGVVAILKQDLVVIWSSFKGLYVKRLL